jgi:hypothetical protein
VSAARRPVPPRRPAPSRRRPEIAPPPIEPRDARGIAAGLLVFAAGLAVGGVLALAGLGGTPGWSIAVAVGLLAIGVVGVYQRRTASPVPRPAIWSPAYLADVAPHLGLPARGFTVAFYALLAVGLVGNLVVPLVRG